MVKVGFLQCDTLDAPHVDVEGDYDVLFERLLAGQGIELARYRTDLGELPRSTRDCDAWLVPGSRHSVYEDLEWIAALKRFATRLLDQSCPLVGVCFGHQLIAQLLGAPVARAETGWSIGAIDYRLRAEPPGEAGQPETVTLIASHQDQVLELPEGTTLLAEAPTCPIAGYMDGSVLAVQAHPEFSARLARSLYTGRRDRLGTSLVTTALETLDEQLDHQRIANWIGSFVARANA